MSKKSKKKNKKSPVDVAPIKVVLPEGTILATLGQWLFVALFVGCIVAIIISMSAQG
jgi:hypothetical protein